MAFQTVRAAEALLTDSSRDLWALADAVLADVPAVPERGGGTNPPRAGVNGIDDQLAELADALAVAGIVKPDGDPYSARSLANLRGAAMSWPPEQRFADAAYRTHQEAGTFRSPAAKALDALCRHASGGSVRRPHGVDGPSWKAALENIDRKRQMARPPRFLVAANDLRTAMGNRPNVPGRQIDPAEIVEAIKANPEVAQAIAADDEAREAVEEEGIYHRAGQPVSEGVKRLIEEEPHVAGRRAARNINEALGDNDSDMVVSELRRAAGFIAEAIAIREQFTVEVDPEPEAKALAKIERYLAAYREKAELTDADRTFLDSLGITL